MFIHCPHCHALVATDPATDEPPPHCPRCEAVLRETEAPVAPPAPAAAPTPEAGTAHDPVELAPAPGEAVATGDTLADRPGADGGQAAMADGPADPELAQAAEMGPELAGVHDPADDPAPVVPTDDDVPEVAAVPMRKPAHAATAPRFTRVRTPATAGERRPWLLPTLIAGLSLLLVLQWVLADRAALAADARWRPLVAQLCAVLRCSLPAWREPDAFVLLDRDVRPHPTLPGVLRVSATFRNDARWPQPWPGVVLTLSDVEGRTVGARTFAAAEYLRAAPTQNELASGQSASIRMDVLEPTPRSVAFAFDFQ